jgi:hypothetical protein
VDALVVFEVLVGVLDTPPPMQAADQACPVQHRVGGEDLEDDLAVLVGRQLADRCGVVAVEVDHLVCEGHGVPLPVDVHPRSLGRDGGDRERCPAPGDPLQALYVNLE